MLARKKDGSFPFCVDFRHLNGVTKKDVHPLPRIDVAQNGFQPLIWRVATGRWRWILQIRRRLLLPHCLVFTSSIASDVFWVK